LPQTSLGELAALPQTYTWISEDLLREGRGGKEGKTNAEKRKRRERKKGER